MIKSYRDIIKNPVITEKSMEATTNNQYTFEVAEKANKIEIRKAVEDIFKVKVLKVNTSKVRGKERRLGRYSGKTSDWKKAIVTLKAGDKIEIGGVSLFEH